MRSLTFLSILPQDKKDHFIAGVLAYALAQAEATNPNLLTLHL